ncbi:membrane protein insertion efficiency factor YidD [Psychrobacter ciconiae]|uniref:membrane protein insertion efficiency factor YidD n=1 Tax=Psychrobacter ciconiae TaxID=1553449 RepID=UPI00191B491C|nr:membrane protein insertion efficiency factor YidD [Psychrobacter ciconiae]
MKILKSLEKHIFVFVKKAIVFYQFFISPIIPARCRYYPTCSNYGKQALDWHGGIKGSGLLLKRLARCQPFGGHGIDFVPLPLDRFIYYPVKKNQAIHVGVLKDNTSYQAQLNLWLGQESKS